jgi:hypothetical protein
VFPNLDRFTANLTQFAPFQPHFDSTLISTTDTPATHTNRNKSKIGKFKMPKRIYKEEIMSNATLGTGSLADKARERRLRALMTSNRNTSNIFA